MPKYHLNPDEFPSFRRMMIGLAAIRNESHDPDRTMQFAFTQRELAATVYGLNLIQMLHPELGGVVVEMVLKIEELSRAQHFLPEGMQDE